jgi:hypothetical protein
MARQPRLEFSAAANEARMTIHPRSFGSGGCQWWARPEAGVPWLFTSAAIEAVPLACIGNARHELAAVRSLRTHLESAVAAVEAVLCDNRRPTWDVAVVALAGE